MLNKRMISADAKNNEEEKRRGEEKEYLDTKK